MENYKKIRNLVIYGGAGIVISILMVSLGFLIYGRIYSAGVTIMVAPSIAKVRIGEMNFSASETIKIQPGEYVVEISADGFETKTGKLVAEADKNVDLNLYLEPSSDATANWYDEHASDALIVGEIKNKEMLKETTKLYEKYPVLKQLPLTVEYFSDDYSKYVKYVISYEIDDSENGFHLIMKDYTGEGVGAAITKLGEMGMDTVGLEIEYEDLRQQDLNYRAE